MKLKQGRVSEEERFSLILPSQRILLISYCHRSSAVCKAKIIVWGLECVKCSPLCQINLLRKAALDYGYKGVCIAPSSSMALKFIVKKKTQGILAIACQKELDEGILSVTKLTHDKNKERLPIVIVPLLKDGCVDTKVDLKLAISKISLGCLKKV